MRSHNKKSSNFRLSLLAITIPFLAACNNKEEVHQPSRGPLPVSVNVAKSVSVPKALEVVAQAEGSREIEVRARVGGILEDQKYRDGQHVNQGDILYVLDKQPLSIAVDKARGSAMEATARAKQAIREESRLAKLYAGKAISQKEYEASISEREMAQAAQVSSKASLREAELNLSYATVRAPINGVVGKTEKSVGSLITVGSDSLLAKMVQIDPVWVNFSLSLQDVRTLGLDKQGSDVVDSVEAILPDGSVYEIKGKINFMDSKVDTNLSTVQLRAEFNNPNGKILPGQFIRVRLGAGAYEKAYLIPQAAVLQSETGRFVYTVSKDNHVAVTPVEAGPWQGTDWVITGGLKEGDQIVIDNLIKLRPGAEIAPKTPAGEVTE